MLARAWKLKPWPHKFEINWMKSVRGTSYVVHNNVTCIRVYFFWFSVRWLSSSVSITAKRFISQTACMIHQFSSSLALCGPLLKTDSGRPSHFTLEGVNAIKLDTQLHSHVHTFRETHVPKNTPIWCSCNLSCSCSDPDVPSAWQLSCSSHSEPFLASRWYVCTYICVCEHKFAPVLWLMQDQSLTDPITRLCQARVACVWVMGGNQKCC